MTMTESKILSYICCVRRIDLPKYEICTTAEVTDDRAYFTSPGHPNNYPPNMDCLFKISLDQSCVMYLLIALMNKAPKV